MIRRSPLELNEGRVISTQIRPHIMNSGISEIRIEVLHNVDTELGYWARLSFDGKADVTTLDLDTFREVARAVESLVNAHHKRNGKAKAGKGKAVNAGSSA